MKYKLLKELPFLDKDSIFETGCWSGYGVDMEETHYSGGGSSHNGTKVFNETENIILESIKDKKPWVQKIPSSANEALSLYKSTYFNEKEFLNIIILDPLKEQA